MVRRQYFLIACPAPRLLARRGSRGNRLGDVSETESGNAADPALASALQDQIMVDPQLGRRANGDAIRPPGQPYSGAVPNDNVAANAARSTMRPLLKTPAPT